MVSERYASFSCHLSCHAIVLLTVSLIGRGVAYARQATSDCSDYTRFDMLNTLPCNSRAVPRDVGLSSVSKAQSKASHNAAPASPGLDDATLLASLASNFKYQTTCAATHTGKLCNGRDCGMSPLVCHRCVLRVQASAGYDVSQGAPFDAPGRILDDRSQARCQSRLLAASHTRTQRLPRFPGIGPNVQHHVSGSMLRLEAASAASYHGAQTNCQHSWTG